MALLEPVKDWSEGWPAPAPAAPVWWAGRGP